MIASFRKEMAKSPAYARVAPFVIFLLLTYAPTIPGLSSIPAAEYWFYLIKTVIGAWLIWEMRSFIPEMRWVLSWEAVVVGVVVFIMWVGIDPLYPHMKVKDELWNPFKQFGDGSLLAWTFIVVRTLGMTFVVPPLEEVFWRSFLYRFIIRYDFPPVSMMRFDGIAFVLTSALFGFEHQQWLAGVLCGFAFQGLVLRKGRIGDAITAHAITNFLLAVWVVWKSDWKFF